MYITFKFNSSSRHRPPRCRPLAYNGMAAWRQRRHFTHYLSNSHFPPPLRQTARCVFVLFPRVLSVTLHCRAVLNFQVSSLSATTPLSGCTQFSNLLLCPLPLLCRVTLNFKVCYFVRFHYIVGLYSISSLFFVRFCYYLCFSALTYFFVVALSRLRHGQSHLLSILIPIQPIQR